MIPLIVNCSTSNEAWTVLQKTYQDTGLTRRISLLRCLLDLKLENCKNMEEYVKKNMEISQQLRDINAGLPDDLVAVMVLSGLTKEFDS